MGESWKKNACPLNCQCLRQGITTKGMGFVCTRFRKELELGKEGIPDMLMECKASAIKKQEEE